MESTQEIRYYLSGKKSWNDVTIAVNRKDLPKKGQVINVGKIKMAVKDVVDGTSNGRHVTKVFLESTGMPYTQVDEAIDMLDNPTFIEIKEHVNEARSQAVSNRGDSRAYVSVGGNYTDSPGRAVPGEGPGAPGTLGGIIRSQLTFGVGYGVQVADFGEAVTITITYSNAKTGKSASQSFVIVYHGKYAKNVYTVYANCARWRNCNDVNQAISFIRSKATSIPNMCASAL